MKYMIVRKYFFFISRCDVNGCLLQPNIQNEKSKWEKNQIKTLRRSITFTFNVHFLSNEYEFFGIDF